MMDVRENPPNTEGPYCFTDEEGNIEGKVNSVFTLLDRFEPMDVLNGKTVVYDSQGRRILIQANDEMIIEKNEYPKDYEGIHYEVGGVTAEFLSQLDELKRNDRLPESLD